jgi:hypothetical protein
MLGSISAVIGIEKPAPLPLSSPLFIRLKAATFDPLREEPNFPPDLRISSYPEGETGFYIVQFSGPVRPEWKEQIRELGGILSWYIPDYAFLVRMYPSVKTRIQSLPFVRWVGIYQPAYKIHPHLLDGGMAEPITVYILTSSVDSLNSISSKIGALGGKVLAVAALMIKAQVRASEISGLAAMNDVIWIEPWAPCIAFNDTARWVIQSGTSGFTPVHDNGIQGQSQIVTIADTGLRIDASNRPSHEMFVDPDKTAGANHRKVHAYYIPVGASGALGDESGHGTHVAGTVAGDAGIWGTYDSVLGSSGKHDGQAFTARIVMQDIDNSSDIYVYPPDDYANLFQPAYDIGSSIHTNSWGGENEGGDLSWYNTSAQMIDDFMWRHKNFQVLFALGNKGPDPNSLTFEAQAKNAISVGATRNGASADSIWDYSSRGYADDGRIKPTIVAPGVYVWSADYGGDNLYIQMSGTSMATPTAAGAVALILQYYSEGWYPTGGGKPIDAFEPSSALIRATLINGAIEISGSGAYQNSNRYPNGDQGWGRVNLNNSLYFKGDTKRMWVVDNILGVATGQTAIYQIQVDDNTQPLKFTLTWTDYPSSPAASVQLVNDLNLRVTDPNGIVYLGNVFTSYNPGYSTTGGAPDNRNVEETVLLLPDNNKFPSGTYTVEVIGYNVPSGEAGTNAQPFALVVTGGIADSQTYIPPPQKWTHTNWEGGPTKPMLKVGTWNRTYFDFFDNENVNWSSPGQVRLAGSSPAFRSAGWFESSIYDAGGIADWKEVSWVESKPIGTNIVVKVRTGNDNNPYDGGWSAWHQHSNGEENISMPDGRYVQYRAELSTTVGTKTPELFEVTLNYEILDSTPPPAPTLLEPADGTMTKDNTPTFGWTAVTDDSPPVTYELQVDNDLSFSSPEISVSGLIDNIYTPTMALADENYSWRVRATDNAGNIGAWSSVWTLLIDTVPPAAPDLLSPADGENLVDNTPLLDWSDVVDPSGVSYDLFIATDNEFTLIILQKIGLTTSQYELDPSEALSENTYYWRVRAVDGAGNVGDNSTYRSFTVRAGPPSVYISISPSRKGGIPGASLKFTVTVKNTGNAVDSYDLVVGDNAGWGLALDDNLLENVAPGENRTTGLTVTIPDNENLIGMEDTVTVTATSRENIEVSDNATCIAYAGEENTFQLELLAGWNLVGFPVTGENITPDNLFPGLDYTIYYWEAPHGPYNEPPSNWPVEDNLGYWVKLNQDDNVGILGVLPTSRTIYLVAGWNLVHFPVTSENTTPDNLFPGLDYTMYYWEAPNGPYNESAVNQPVQPGVGYWVKINRETTITVPL